LNPLRFHSNLSPRPGTDRTLSPYRKKQPLPISRHGLREILLTFLVCAAAGAGIWFLYPPAAPAPLALFLFVLCFFRDFERSLPAEPDAIVSPADGRVTEIAEVEETTYVKGPAVKIGIFLSVLNCHINRAPWDGTVEYVRYFPGLFLDARHPDSGPRNEANAVGLHDGSRNVRMLVRQVAGLIARRIVCPMKVGDTVARGARIGMIKFGSRTELYVPKDRVAAVCVQVGDTVYGASTTLARLK
jgi:phosphatidylserine decarboxylase